MSWYEERHNCENQSATVVKEGYFCDAYNHQTDHTWRMYTHGYGIKIIFCPFCGVKLP